MTGFRLNLTKNFLNLGVLGDLIIKPLRFLQKAISNRPIFKRKLFWTRANKTFLLQILISKQKSAYDFTTSKTNLMLLCFLNSK